MIDKWAGTSLTVAIDDHNSWKFRAVADVKVWLASGHCGTEVIVRLPCKERPKVALLDSPEGVHVVGMALGGVVGRGDAMERVSFTFTFHLAPQVVVGPTDR